MTRAKKLERPPVDAVEASLAAAVYGAPADDAPRLVYADYLLERGKPYGRFISMQCTNEDPKAARNLAAGADASWLGPLSPAIVDPQECIFARGFPVSARVKKEGWPIDELSEHDAWSTYSRVTVPRDAKKRFPKLLFHLKRRKVEVLLEPTPGSTAETKKDLREASKSGGNGRWFGVRALSRLGADEDRVRVEIAMRKVFEADLSGCGRKITDQYVPLAWSVLGKIEHPVATFLASFDADDDGLRLRLGSEWLRELGMIYVEERVDAMKTVQKGSKLAQRLAQLCASQSGIRAARVTVAAYGVEDPRFIGVIAHEGSIASRDVLAPVVEAVLRGDVPEPPAGEKRPLDLLQNWLLPFAKSAAMADLVTKVKGVADKRGEGSTVLALAKRFGSAEKKLALVIAIDSKEVYMGLRRKAYVWLRLHSHKRPSASISIVKAALNSTRTDWDDGALDKDELELGGPTSLDDVPRWVAASANKLGVRWDEKAVRIESSLRGKPRAAALAWLLSGS